MDMLNPGKFFYFSLILFCQSCQTDNGLEDKRYSSATKHIVNEKEYNRIYINATDSIKIWSLNKISNYNFHGKGKDFILDTLLCFNTSGNRLISALLNINTSNPNSDGINYFYGENINGLWYFFRGGYTVIPRSLVKGHPESKPLSYSQLHQIALKEIYSGYLKNNGEINESWFISHFENNGWGTIKNQSYFDWCFKGKRYTNEKEFYIASHLCKVKANWSNINKDSIKPLPPNPLP